MGYSDTKYEHPLIEHYTQDVHAHAHVHAHVTCTLKKQPHPLMRSLQSHIAMGRSHEPQPV